jgi:hypothetical protein
MSSLHYRRKMQIKHPLFAVSSVEISVNLLWIIIWMINIACIQFFWKYFLPEQNYCPNSEILDVSRPECGGLNPGFDVLRCDLRTVNIGIEVLFGLRIKNFLWKWKLFAKTKTFCLSENCSQKRNVPRKV